MLQEVKKKVIQLPAMFVIAMEEERETLRSKAYMYICTCVCIYLEKERERVCVCKKIVRKDRRMDGWMDGGERKFVFGVELGQMRGYIKKLQMT